MRSGWRAHLGRTSPLSAGLGAVRSGEERRLVSAVFVELSPVGLGAQADPEDLRELIGVGLAEAISEAEQFGGTVASVSGFGMSVLFGAPQSHEDDPERALRAALRIVGAVGQASVRTGNTALGAATSLTSFPVVSARIGVETGVAVVGPVGRGEAAGYGALGEVVGTAAALQSAARPGSVLVGPATRAATEGIFEWGPGQDLPLNPGRPTAVGELPRSSRGRARSPRPGAGAWPQRPPSSAGTPSWRCSPRPCGRRSQATAGPSSSSASRGSAKHASSPSAATTSWAGSGPHRGGCRCGWKGAAPRMPRLPPTAPTSSSCPGSSGPRSRAARRCSARPLPAPCTLCSARALRLSPCWRA